MKIILITLMTIMFFACQEEEISIPDIVETSIVKTKGSKYYRDYNLYNLEGVDFFQENDSLTYPYVEVVNSHKQLTVIYCPFENSSDSLIYTESELGMYRYTLYNDDIFASLVYEVIKDGKIHILDMIYDEAKNINTIEEFYGKALLVNYTISTFDKDYGYSCDFKKIKRNEVEALTLPELELEPSLVINREYLKEDKIVIEENRYSNSVSNSSITKYDVSEIPIGFLNRFIYCVPIIDIDHPNTAMTEIIIDSTF